MTRHPTHETVGDAEHWYVWTVRTPGRLNAAELTPGREFSAADDSGTVARYRFMCTVVPPRPATPYLRAVPVTAGADGAPVAVSPRAVTVVHRSRRRP